MGRLTCPRSESRILLRDVDTVCAAPRFYQEGHMRVFHSLWDNQQGQDIAEYAVMLAVILVLVVGTIRLVGSNANNAFSSAASSIN